MSDVQHMNDHSGIPIVVGERPMVFWDPDPAQTQRAFLTSIDPGYFAYQQRVHEAQLGTPDDLHAAVALRQNYAHALETLLALIGAALQAPHYPAGWMLKYHVKEVEDLVQRITDQSRFLHQVSLERGGWSEVAQRLCPFTLEEDRQAEHWTATAVLWRFLAKEFRDQHLQDEYNSLKHGLRVHPGPWTLAMGIEETPGVAAPPERMRIVAQDAYGSLFLRPIYLKKHQFALEEQRVNWTPSDFLGRLPLVIDSIHNVLTFLKDANGMSSEDMGVWLIDKQRVDDGLAGSAKSSGVRFSIRPRFVPKTLPDLMPEAILAAYHPQDC